MGGESTYIYIYIERIVTAKVVAAALEALEEIISHSNKINKSIYKRYFHQRAHSTEQSHFTTVFSSGTHFTDESTETMQIKCLAYGHDILM